MPEETIRCPFPIAHLTHELGLDPRRRVDLGDLLRGERLAALLEERAKTRSISADQRIEQSPQLLQLRVAETCSHSTGINELAVHIIGELECTDVRAAFFRRREADDDEIARLVCLDLEPLVRPS